MVLGCGFVCKRRRAVFGVKFDVLKVWVFAQCVGVLAVKIYEPKVWVKFALLLQI
nr:hypothetical protein [uncultured Campylobacter sp.]